MPLRRFVEGWSGHSLRVVSLEIDNNKMQMACVKLIVEVGTRSGRFERRFVLDLTFEIHGRAAAEIGHIWGALD
jgi:predicted AAA+ superfamily ATPase